MPGLYNQQLSTLGLDDNLGPNTGDCHVVKRGSASGMGGMLNTGRNTDPGGQNDVVVGLDRDLVIGKQTAIK